MRRYVWALGPTLFLTGCLDHDDPPADPTTTTGGPHDGPEWPEVGPYRDQWRTEVDANVAFRDGEGLPTIVNITVGGREHEGNFANRGDVQVKFDGPEDHIKVELRRFTYTESLAQAEETYRLLHLWAFAASTPRQPASMDPSDDCRQTWQDECQIRIWYEGRRQLLRSGADIRVTLPPSYRHQVDIVTEDVTIEGSYLLRGDVCIQDLPGSANVTLDDGVSLTRLHRAIVPGPTCTADELDACDLAGWDPACPCSTYGRVDVRGGTTDVTVDVPSHLWTSAFLENAASDPTPCDVEIDVPGVKLDPRTLDDPGRTLGFLNHPGDHAIVGGGYSVQLWAEDCSPVYYSPYPSAWPGKGNEDLQRNEIRGNLTMCSDCLAPMDCDTWLEEL